MAGLPASPSSASMRSDHIPAPSPTPSSLDGLPATVHPGWPDASQPDRGSPCTNEASLGHGSPVRPHSLAVETVSQAWLPLSPRNLAPIVPCFPYICGGFFTASEHDRSCCWCHIASSEAATSTCQASLVSKPLTAMPVVRQLAASTTRWPAPAIVARGLPFQGIPHTGLLPDPLVERSPDGGKPVIPVGASRHCLRDGRRAQPVQH